MEARRVGTAGAVAVCLALAGWRDAGGQLRDHLQCFKVKDPLVIQGVANVTTRFGGDSFCKVGKAKLYCEPGTKTVVSSNHAILPVVGRGLLDSRICYRLRCRNEVVANFSGATDQFASHRFVSNGRGKLLCVPAVAGPPSTSLDNLDDVKCYKAAENTLDLHASAQVDTAHLGTFNNCLLSRSGDGSSFGMPSGDGALALDGQAGCPEDVDVGPDGTVYFTDLFTQRIRVLTREPF